MEFKLTDIEKEYANNWIEKHKKTCPYSFKNYNLPTTGEHYYYKFIPGGLGYHVLVGCIYCNKEKDVTDTTYW